MHKKFPEFRDTTVYDSIYDLLEENKDGLSIQSLSSRLDLSVATIQKNIDRLKEDIVVERVMKNDRFVYKLTE